MMSVSKYFFITLFIVLMAAMNNVRAQNGPGVDETRDIVMKWVASHDTNYVTENVVFTDMSSGDEIVGRKALAEFLYWFWNVAFETDLDEIQEHVQYIIGHGQAGVESMVIGIHSGAFGDIPPSYNEVEVPLAIVYELETEAPYRIERARIYPLMNILIDQITTSVNDYAGDVPREYQLMQNYPNPFNPSTSIRFAIPKQEHVTLVVFDLLGRVVATLVDETLAAGEHTVTFDAHGQASGIYLYRLQTDSFDSTRRFVFIK